MFTLGSYAFDNNLALAPMAGVTDAVFRKICKEKGAGIVVGEMLSAKLSLKTEKKGKTAFRVANLDEPSPRIIQLLGNDPEEMAEAARFNVEKGADIIDINMGCPAKKVCKKAAGSSLLRDEGLVRAILEAVVDSVDVPVTLKTRTGWSEEQKNIIDIAQIAQSAGIQMLTVHGRTREQKFNGDAEYDILSDVKKNIDIPFLVNGDIDSPQKAQQVLEQTQADGLMIGRAAQGNPWLFQEISAFLTDGTILPRPELPDIKKTILSHLSGIHLLYGEYSGARIARKHIGWYFEYLPNMQQKAKAFFKISDAEQQLDFIQNHLTLNDLNAKLTAV